MTSAQQILEELHSIRRKGYGSVLPGEFDAKFIDLAEIYAAADANEREAIRASVLDDGRLLLLGFSDRLAIVAERTANPDLLLLALVAHSIEDFRYDERENICHLALVNHVAEKLGARPSALFEQAAQLSSAQGAAALKRFNDRPKPLKSLRAMRIVESQTDAGIDYRYG